MQKIGLGAEDGDRFEQNKSVIMDRVRLRFSSVAKAEAWFIHGRIPGYGEKTPEHLVRIGKGDQVILALDAIRAGVHA